MEILLILLGLGAFGLYSKAILASTIGMIFVNVKKKRRFNKLNNINFIVLILFSITYAIIAYIHKLGSLSLIITPWIAYYFGILISNENEKENTVFKFILSIAIGFVLHALLNFIYALIINSAGRNTLDIWTRQSTAATVQGTLLVMIESLLYYIVMCEKNIKRKIVLLILFTLGVIYNIKIGTRTTLLICFIVFISSLLLDLLMSNQKKRILKKIGAVLLVITIIVLVFCIGYFFNILNMKDRINDIELVKRFINKQETNASDNERWMAIKSAMSQIFDYPFGGDKMQIGKIKYAHNMWLDVNRVAGIIPFILIILYTALIIRNVIIVIKSKKYSNAYKIFLFSIYLGVLINFAVEPIMESTTYFFIMFCMINGMVDTNIVMNNLDTKNNLNNKIEKYIRNELSKKIEKYVRTKKANNRK